MNTTSVAFVNSRITLTNTCYRRLGATSDMVCLTVKNKLFQLGLSLGWDWDPRPFIYKTHISRNVVCPQPLLFPTSSRSLPHQSRDHYYPTRCDHTPNPVPVTTGLSIHDTDIFCLTTAQAQLCFLWVMDAHMDEHAASNKHRKLSCFQ